MSVKKKQALLAGIIFCFCAMLAFEAWKMLVPAEGGMEKHLYSLITTAIGSALFLLVVIYSSYSRVLKINVKEMPRHILFALPCVLVAVNNFPIIPFFSGKAYISGKGSEIFLYFLVCVGTGFFEELVFRAYILMILLEKKKDGVKGVFWAVVGSSALFGLIHLVNIFSGADPLATLMQVGYSFLVGGMCAIVMLKTGSVWYSVLLHAVYNFAGGVIPRFGGGTIWDAPTVAITAVLAVLVAIYLVFTLIRLDAEKTDAWIGCN